MACHSCHRTSNPWLDGHNYSKFDQKILQCTRYVNMMLWGGLSAILRMIASRNLSHVMFSAGVGRQNAASSSRSTSRVHATKTDEPTLDQYEGQGNRDFSNNYLNPDAKSSEPDDVKYEHPADLEMPIFHPMPMRGFMSDPCGPMYDPIHERSALSNLLWAIGSKARIQIAEQVMVMHIACRASELRLEHSSWFYLSRLLCCPRFHSCKNWLEQCKELVVHLLAFIWGKCWRSSPLVCKRYQVLM